jgi:hypothetical protein
MTLWALAAGWGYLWQPWWWVELGVGGQGLGILFPGRERRKSPVPWPPSFQLGPTSVLPLGW